MAQTDTSKTPKAPSRPSLAKMQQVKSAAKRSSTPKVVSKKAAPSAASAPATRKPSVTSRPSLAKMQQVKASAKKPPRKRSATGSAPRITIAGRHVPPNLRYKTGWWRPVRQSWMSQEVWEAYKAINRFKNKTMSKGLKKASLGEKIYGKEGPGHAGYGSGQLQKWADKMTRKGEDPHMVDMVKWFAGAAAAIDFHTGERNFDDLMKAQRKDPDHFMRYIIERMEKYIPEVKKLSKSAISDIMRHKYYTAQYGPDGRAK